MAIHYLIVDDEEMLLRALLPHVEALAAERGGSVHCVTGPQEALAVLQRLPGNPLVVLSDFNLKADRTGLDLLRDVARERPDALRVLMSGYDEDQLGIDGEPIDAFLEKPLYLATMIPPLRKLVATRFG